MAHLLVEWKRASKPPRKRRSPMLALCASKGLSPLPQLAASAPDKRYTYIFGIRTFSYIYQMVRNSGTGVARQPQSGQG